ncbi:MAG: FtsQ-type POTRA domain-containing protein [Nitriliruptoraceae bacterium]
MIDERIAERRAAVRDDQRRDRLRRTRRTVLVVLLLAGLVALERSPLVGLEEVEIAGTQRLSTAQVSDAADLELGTSTLRLGLQEVIERVEALPLVHRATARRTDPLSVRIEITERVPSLVASGEGTSRYLDRDGVVIDDLGPDERPRSSLPVIALLAVPPPVGELVAADPALANAHAVWAGLTGSLRAEVATYRAAGPDELTLELQSGIEVRFGRAERTDEKVRALGAVLDDVGDTPIGSIDVRAPQAPVVVAP